MSWLANLLVVTTAANQVPCAEALYQAGYIDLLGDAAGVTYGRYVPTCCAR